MDRALFENVINQVPQYDKVQATIIYNSGSRVDARIARGNGGGLIAMNPGSRRYGRRLYADEIRDILIAAKKEKDLAASWYNGWRRVESILIESGLWNDVRENITIALSVGYDKIQAAYKISNTYEVPGLTYEQRDQWQVEQIAKIDPCLITDNNRIDLELLWRQGHGAKVKKMCFDNYQRDRYLDQIAAAMRDKREFQCGGRTSYDVSFHFKPEGMKAWYSEEFKNCGNGHYYLAINSTHALFYEDD